MRNTWEKCNRRSLRLILLAVPMLLAGGVAVAENIDPANDGSKYAWAENLGWINLRPLGAGGPGVQVSDSGLTGWAWSENAGWITFSSTGPNPYQIVTSWRRTCTDTNTCPEPTSGTVVS